MRLNLKHWALVTTMLCAVLLFSCSEKKETKPTDKKVKVEKTACECESSWFPHANTQATNDGKGGPFDTNSTTNCQFHQWSWQKFLWLTKPAENGLPLFQSNLYQVGGSMKELARKTDDTVVITDVFQAGSNGILKTNAAFATDKKAHTVMYSIHVDKKMLGSSINFKSMLLNKKLSPTNDSTFPNGALELKVAWVDATAISEDEIANYYTTLAEVDTGNGSEKSYTKVALLGMHVVGRVINHPEFIWATFEHASMSPDYDWAATTSSTDAPITNASDMLLFKKGTVNGTSPIVWDKASNTPFTPSEAFNVYHHGVPRVPGGGFLPTKQNGDTNYKNIISINKCVRKGLGSDVWGNYFYKGSIWINMDGTTPAEQAKRITEFGGGLGNIENDTNLRGSLGISNITMETYTQVFVDTAAKFHALSPNSIGNCMSCHTGQPRYIVLNGDTLRGQLSPLYVSHLFRSYLDVNEKTSMAKARLLRVREFYERMKALKENKE